MGEEGTEKEWSRQKAQTCVLHLRDSTRLRLLCFVCQKQAAVWEDSLVGGKCTLLFQSS